MDFKSTALPVEASPPAAEQQLRTIPHLAAWPESHQTELVTVPFHRVRRHDALYRGGLTMTWRSMRISKHLTFARQGVRFYPVPVALVGKCSVPVAQNVALQPLSSSRVR